MGVYIKDARKPKNCYDCWWFSVCRYGARRIPYMSASSESPEFCPIVEVDDKKHNGETY